MQVRAVWSPQNNLSSLFPGCGSFFFFLGTYWHPRWAIGLLQPAHIYHFFAGLLFLGHRVARNKLPLPQRINISSAESLTIPEACTFSLRWQARDMCVHTGSRSEATQCLQEAREELCLAAGDLQLPEEGEAVPRPLLLLQEDSGLFWMETWKEVHKF